jgi:glycosyltransferase involved in cell wall biosynthesis
LKIAVVTQFPADATRPKGGVESVSVNLIRALAAISGNDVQVVTIGAIGEPETIQTWEGATIHRLTRQRGGTLQHAIGEGRRRVCACVSKLAPDIVHAHDTYGLMVAGLPYPRVFTIHGFIYGDTLVSGRKFPWVRSRLWKWIEQRGWRDQSAIISISPYVRERLTGVVKKPIFDIDNPVAGGFFDVERRTTGPVIFSAAVISPRKNTLTLVKALEAVRREGVEATLRLAGPVVDQEYGEMVRAYAKNTGLEDAVTFLGSIDIRGVRAELAQASVFALVSLEENSPMGIEEAMAAGVPVVTSNRCGMPYMVRHGESGFLVDPENVDDIARRIQNVLCDAMLAQSLGGKGREIALDRFHPDRVAKRTLDVYEELARKDMVPRHKNDSARSGEG